MIEKNEKTDRSERSSRTPINVRNNKTILDLTPNKTPKPNKSQIKSFLKDQMLHKDIVNKTPSNSSKNLKYIPFANKKLNLNLTRPG